MISARVSFECHGQTSISLQICLNVARAYMNKKRKIWVGDVRFNETVTCRMYDEWKKSTRTGFFYNLNGVCFFSFHLLVLLCYESSVFWFSLRHWCNFSEKWAPSLKWLLNFHVEVITGKKALKFIKKHVHALWRIRNISQRKWKFCRKQCVLSISSWQVVR